VICRWNRARPATRYEQRPVVKLQVCAPLAQSASLAHVFLHAVPEHAKGVHIAVAPGTQVPAPLHVAAATTFILPLQAAGAHCVPAG